MSGKAGRTFGDWLADSVRFTGALVYWNARKAAYRYRGARGRCPCQNQSDDSIPYHVRCNAAAHWNDPGRFRRVCPLLASTPAGWRCSVHARDVQPFWGRALAGLGAGVLASYLLVTLLVFGALNVATGARPSWWQVAWPGAWSSIREDQANFLYDRAMRAFARGSLNEAQLALVSAVQRDARHYEAAVLLAQVTMFQGSYLHADQLFAALQQQHPAEAVRTAVTYHDTLLSLGRTDRLAEHCLTMVEADSARAAVWVRSLLLALRNDSRAAADLAVERRSDIAQLPPHARRLVQAEIEWHAGNRAGALDLLRQRFGGPYNLHYMQLQVERLAELGKPADAQALLDFYGPILGDVNHAFVQFTLHRRANEDWAARMLFRRLLTGPFDARRVEQFAAALIKTPEAELFRELSARVESLPGLAREMAATMWATALACGEPRLAQQWAASATPPVRPSIPAISQLEFASRDLQDPQSVVHVINVVTLPRETIMALLTRMDRSAPSKRTLRLNVGG